MKADIYARALHILGQRGLNPDQLIANLKGVLQRKGLDKLLPRIYRAYRHLLEVQKKHKPQLIVARESDINNAVKELSITDLDRVNIKIDKRYIGGYKYIENGNLIDNSFKNKLLQAYRNAIKNN